MRGKRSFKRSSSYVHIESISKQASSWDWKSPVFAVLGYHWLRLGNAQLSNWKILYSTLPTHKSYAATNAGQMQDIGNRHDGRNEFHKGRGPHQYQANCCEIAQGTFLKSSSTRYLVTNQHSRSIVVIMTYHSSILMSRWAILRSKFSKQKPWSDFTCLNPLSHGTNRT